jgi:drug/metabolite transporter (DMT)-like permease
MWAMGLICYVIGLISGAPILPTNNMVWLSLLYLAIFPASVSLFLQLNAQRFVSANQVGIVTSLEPVFASIFAWWLASEAITVHTAIGGSLIFSAMVISELPNKRKS